MTEPDSKSIGRLCVIMGMVGFTTLTAQMLFMREFVIIFFGNELCLGALFALWLLWTAAGSAWLPRLIPPDTHPFDRFRAALASIALAVMATPLLIRLSPFLIRPTPGETVGLGSMLLAGFMVFAPLCLSSGYAYASAVALAREGTADTTGAIGRIFFSESMGAGAGGVAGSFFLFPHTTPVQTAFLLFGCVGSTVLGTVSRPARKIRPMVQALFWTAVLSGAVASGPLQRALDRWRWRGQDLVVSKNTSHGNLAVTRLGNQVTVYADGLPLFTDPDPLTDEESVHYALLQHPAPKRVLVVGGNPGGVIEQAYRHPSVTAVEFVEPDPEVIRLARLYLPPGRQSGLNDPRTIIRTVDARRFIEGTANTYDAVLLNLPSPHTAQRNRFYTVEFFGVVQNRLAPGGVFSLSLSSSENAIGAELGLFLGTVRATLARVFPETEVLPGENCRFFASRGSGRLTADPEELARRLRARGLRTQYVRPHFIKTQFSNERRRYLFSRFRTAPENRSNTDFRPLAFWYTFRLWIRHFSPELEKGIGILKKADPAIVIGCLSVAVFVFVSVLWKKRSLRLGAAVVGIGFSGIAVELMLLLAYQVLYGVLLRHMAVIVAAYMAGTGLGSRAALRMLKPSPHDLRRRVALFCGAAAVLPLLTVGLLNRLHGMHLSETHALLGTLSICILNGGMGFTGGFAFLLANRAFLDSDRRRKNAAGTLYGLDLLGSVFGALASLSLMVPLAGLIHSLLVVFGVNAFALLVLVLSCQSS